MGWESRITGAVIGERKGTVCGHRGRGFEWETGWSFRSYIVSCITA